MAGTPRPPGPGTQAGLKSTSRLRPRSDLIGRRTIHPRHRTEAQGHAFSSPPRRAGRTTGGLPQEAIPPPSCLPQKAPCTKVVRSGLCAAPLRLNGCRTSRSAPAHMQAGAAARGHHYASLYVALRRRPKCLSPPSERLPPERFGSPAQTRRCCSRSCCCRIRSPRLPSCRPPRRGQHRL